MKQQFEVNRKDLVKFMINDDIDGLAEYIENLITDNFINGYIKGCNNTMNEVQSEGKRQWIKKQ